MSPTQPARDEGDPSSTRASAGAPVRGPRTALGLPVAAAGKGTAATVRPRRSPVTSTRGRRSDFEAFMRVPVDERQAGGWDPFPGLLDEAEPQAIAVTYRLPPLSAPRVSAAIRVVGVRQGVTGRPGPRDRFQRVERFTDVPGGKRGSVSLTSRVEGIASGEWRVRVEPVECSVPDVTLPTRMIQTRSRFAPLAQGVGVRLWAWPLLVGSGAAVALVAQAVLAARAGLDVAAVLALSAFACLVGFLGGKLWYLAQHRKGLKDFLRSGACIQGFLLAALAVLAAGSQLRGLPTGTVLDITAPGVFFGIAVGRPGCWLTGCCVGRPTTSRGGLVSSDRRLRIRRIPVQLYESAAGAAIGAASLTAVLVGVGAPGSVFAVAVTAYTLVRQLLFPFRGDPHTVRGRLVTILLSTSLLAVALVTLNG